MKKNLQDMSLEELWQLFPIYLTEHDHCWERWYEEESEALLACLPEGRTRRISHIGSTAIKGIWAKPIVDMLIEIYPEYDIEDIAKAITHCGYICMSKDNNRISFNKGYTVDGFDEKVFHLHLRYAGDNDELYFRDYLNDHPNTAKEYEDLKLSLWKEYENDRDGYTEAKTSFVSKATRLAKEAYPGRYN